VVITALVVATAIAAQRHAMYQATQHAQMAALNDAVRSGTGHYGYFSQVVKYEQAFQAAAFSSPITHPYDSALMATPLFLQNDAELWHLRDLYKKLAQQAREHARTNTLDSALP